MSLIDMNFQNNLEKIRKIASIKSPQRFDDEGKRIALDYFIKGVSALTAANKSDEDYWWFFDYFMNFKNNLIIRYCIPKRVVNSLSGLHKACDKIHKAQHEIQCVVVADRLSCLKLLSVGKADFMVAEPEDLRVISAYNESGIVVTHQLKKFAESKPQREVEMIVVVKSESDTVLTGKGKKLCYLGLETSHVAQFDYYYTTYFESWLFPRSCDPNKNEVENRVASLSAHFESACIAGPWSLDRKMDADLKAKYKNLCALCGNPRSCDDDDRYYGTTGALTCLRQGIGNLAWLSRSDASKYFSQLGSYGFSLLCPDGTARVLSSKMNDTCTWIVDPRPVIVANKNVAHIVLDKVTDMGEEKSNFYQVVHSSYVFSYLKKLDKPMTTKEYLLKRYSSASVKAKSTCRSNRIIRWCVSSSLEARKCQSLRRSSNALELSPGFTCVEMPSSDECIRAVSTFKSDVFAAKPDERSRSEKYTLRILEIMLGLKSIVEMLAGRKDEHNNVAAVVRKESRFRTVNDLKDAKACFSGYRSVGWNAVYLALKKNNSDRQRLDDVESIATFFKESCVLNIEPKNRSFPSNLYSLCKKDESNLTLEEKTFKCLEDGADVAFVNVSAVRAYASRKSRFSASNHTYIICSLSLEHLFRQRRIQFQVQIALSPKRAQLVFSSKSHFGLGNMTHTAILVHENITKVREDDISLTFLGLNRYFGRTFDRETPMFEMYGPYENKSNLLFPDATMKLQRASSDVMYVSRDESSDHVLPKVRHSQKIFKTAAKSRSKQLSHSIFAMFNVLCAQRLYVGFF
ncbi:hypothetical protein TSAR_015173 [Trichomalopsis sarcophagae]|uniref:Transferrin-like domain-containing protein n=1 Tax=Trichomalopsis sarcophagae TaxID=543379 RepID=A0A232FF19_9HYME|nr:hypothetical protein TSAR_015173 [Trichomalopsis sarcophagae]